MRHIIVVAMLCMALILPAHAESYVGYGLGAARIESGGAEFQSEAFTLSLGQQFSDRWGLEIRAGVSGNDSAMIAGADVTGRINYALSVLTRFVLAPEDRLQPYLLAGGSIARLEIGGAKTSESDATLGGGLQLALDDSLFLNAEYIQYLDRTSLTVDSFSVGFTQRF